MDAPSWDLAVSLSDILTPRQLDIARCIARGLTLTDAAEALGLSLWTVRQHCYDGGGLYERLGAHSKADIARMVTEANMSDQTEQPREWSDDHDIKPDRIHYVPDTIPAGESAYTDYRGHDCQLRRRKWDDKAFKVTVVGDPLFPGDRAKITQVDGGWEARRE